MKKAVHFGINGRGLGIIGASLEEAGYDLVFIDIEGSFAENLAAAQGYTVQITRSENPQSLEIRGVRVLTDSTQYAGEIASADIVTTSLGLPHLAGIAPYLAEGLKERAQRETSRKLAVMACEQAVNATDFLATFVRELYPAADADAAFANVFIDRDILIEPSIENLTVTVEDYCEWVVEVGPFLDERPHIPAVTWAENLAPYITRQLFTVNTGLSAAAYFGAKAGITQLSQTFQDPRIRRQIEATLAETKDLLVQQFGFSPEEQQNYLEGTMQRLEKLSTDMTVEQMASRPISKLSRYERFISPAADLAELERPIDALLAAIDALLDYESTSDTEACQLSEKLEGLKTGEISAEDLLEELTELEPKHPLYPRLLALFTSKA